MALVADSGTEIICSEMIWIFKFKGVLRAFEGNEMIGSRKKITFYFG